MPSIMVLQTLWKRPITKVEGWDGRILWICYKKGLLYPKQIDTISASNFLGMVFAVKILIAVLARIRVRMEKIESAE